MISLYEALKIGNWKFRVRIQKWVLIFGKGVFNSLFLNGVA